MEEVLARLEPLLGRRDGEAVALDAGITNRNWRARLGGADYVVRVCSPGVDALGIDRDCEHEATHRAAELGIGPEVVARLPEEGVVVTRFLTGGEVPPERLRTAPVLRQVAAALRAFHDGPPLPAVFDVPALVRRQRALLPAVPDRLERGLALAERIQAALGMARVPCHNDLLGANLVLDGDAVRIVDWEYAGMNDRRFDLANLAAGNAFEDADERVLLEAYWGEPASDARLAGLRLMRIVSDLREAVWGLVQAERSELDFDFAAYADEGFARLDAGAAHAEEWLGVAAAA